MAYVIVRWRDWEACTREETLKGTEAGYDLDRYQGIFVAWADKKTLLIPAHRLEKVEIKN